MICTANQLTGFYMSATLALNRLKKAKKATSQKANLSIKKFVL